MMTRFWTVWALVGGLGLFLAAPSSAAQPEDEESDLTAEAEVSVDDLWGDEEEEGEEEEEEREGEGEEEEQQEGEGAREGLVYDEVTGEWVEAGAPKVPWRGTAIYYGHQALLRPFLVTGESADPTYNPYYEQSLSLAPLWYFSDNLIFAPRVTFSQELTNPDERSSRYDVWVSSRATVAYVGLLSFHDISLSPYLRVTFPTTPAQQATTLYLAVAPGFWVSRTLPVLEGLSLNYYFLFTKNLHRYREASAPPQVAACESATNTEDCTTTSQGDRNTNLSLSNSIYASLGLLPTLQLNASAGLDHDLAYSLTPATMDDALTGGHNGVGDESETIAERDAQGGWRFSQSFRVGLTYYVLSYLSASLTVSTTSNQLDPSSERYNPLLPNRYTTAGLSLRLALDTFVNEVSPTRAQGDGARLASRTSGE